MRCHILETSVGSCIIIFMLISISHQATQNNSCPSLCRCLLFEGLWSVYCNRTGISVIPRNIPLSTQLLDLAGNHIQSVRKQDLSYLVNLENLDLSENGLQDGSIDASAFYLPMLQTIDLSYNQFHGIPKTLPRNITTLYFLYNSMDILKSDSFNIYPSLAYVDLSNCAMNRIENNTFDGLKNLSVLYAPFNNLTDDSFPSNLLIKNTRLTLLSLRFNRLRNMLLGLPASLQHIDYVGNNIRTIPTFAFKSLPNLQTIELWQGQVSVIEDNTFYGLPNLTILDMSSDKVSSTITSKTFSGLTGLQTLYFYENQVSKIEPLAFSLFKNITSIWMSGNNLTSLVPEVLDTKFIPHLSELYIDFNPWHCDCHLRWLREKVDNASYVIQDPHLITCASPTKVAGKAWDVLKPDDFVCN